MGAGHDPPSGSPGGGSVRISEWSLLDLDDVHPTDPIRSSAEAGPSVAPPRNTERPVVLHRGAAQWEEEGRKHGG